MHFMGRGCLRAAGYAHGVLEDVRRGMAEAKAAVALAGEALKVNEGAGDILQMLSSSLALAKKDPAQPPPPQLSVSA